MCIRDRVCTLKLRVIGWYSDPYSNKYAISRIARLLKDYIRKHSVHDPRIIFDNLITSMEYTEILCLEADKGTIEMTADVRNAIGQSLVLQKQNLQLIGFEKFQPEVGEIYLNAKGVEKVADINPPSEDNFGKIAEIIAPGYKSRVTEDTGSDIEIIRTAKVTVYKMVMVKEE